MRQSSSPVNGDENSPKHCSRSASTGSHESVLITQKLCTLIVKVSEVRRANHSSTVTVNTEQSSPKHAKSSPKHL